VNTYPPNLILFGGCLLIFGAACANVVFILQAGVSIGHITGDISRIGIGLSAPDGIHTADLLKVAAALLGFTIGATTSGFLIHHPTLDLERPYGWMIAVVGVLLLCSNILLARALLLYAIVVAAFACGLQNALATRYRGMVLRTTHVTGLITDIGVTLGMILRGHQIDRWKLLVPSVFTCFFLMGAICGGILHYQAPVSPLNVVGIGYIICGTTRGLFRLFTQLRKVVSFL